MSSKLPIVIAGGGIGGLSAALALARKGFRVCVLEQAREVGAIGYGIQLGPNAFHMFDRLGLSEAVKRESDYPPDVVWFDAYSGRPVTHVQTGPEFERRFRYPYINIHRGDLHNVLVKACRSSDAIELTTGAAVAGFEQHAGSVTVLTADGARVEGVALIGADGLRSRVRATLFGEHEPHFIGWVAHRTTIPLDQVPAGIDRNIVALWGGAGFHVVHYPLRHGELFNIVTVFRSPTYAQRVDTETYRREILRTYANVHPAMQALIALTDLEWRGAVADRHPIRHWHRGRVVLLGDAAHPTLQSLAQGACMAIEDAVCIAELIALSGGNFEAAFRRFEAERVVRTAHVVLESRYMWTAFHPEDEQARERTHRRYRAMSRDDVWDALAWLYDGYAPPTTMAAPMRAVAR